MFSAQGFLRKHSEPIDSAFPFAFWVKLMTMLAFRHALWVAAVTVCLVISIGAVRRLHAQSTETTQPEFAAASIKLNTMPPGGREGLEGGQLHYTPGRVIGKSVSAWRMILEAYHLSQYQLSGGPRWLESDRYSVEAKAEGSEDEGQLRLMLQTLLRQRFKLAVHRDGRQMQVYALTVNKDGPKLFELAEAEPMPSSKELVSRGLVIPKFDRVAGGLNDRGNIQHFVDTLNQTGKIDRPVINQTGLHGTYLFLFRWDAEENFMTELQEQSGLKFVPEREPVEVMIVDHIERPDAN
jgi:uncharacterized protein (TIGR03435 family)